MNKYKLRAVLAENGDNYEKLAGYLGISTSTLSDKINERNSIGFTQPEMQQIKDRYHLTPEQIDYIFFDR